MSATQTYSYQDTQRRGFGLKTCSVNIIHHIDRVSCTICDQTSQIVNGRLSKGYRTEKRVTVVYYQSYRSMRIVVTGQGKNLDIERHPIIDQRKSFRLTLSGPAATLCWELLTWIWLKAWTQQTKVLCMSSTSHFTSLCCRDVYEKVAQNIRSGHCLRASEWMIICIKQKFIEKARASFTCPSSISLIW